ncbi:MAG: hypothetical protein JXR96_03605 [Deltaproteobacteria bacterium]|nr:hypothetical protein [Deltaproteobacteria bacterium]
MRRHAPGTVSIALLAWILALCAPCPSQAKSKKKGFLHAGEGVVSLGTLMGLPFDGGTGYLLDVEGSVQPIDFLSLGLGVGLSVDPDGHSVPGNLRFSAYSGYSSWNKKDYYGSSIGCNLDVGVGLAEVGAEGALAAESGWASLLDWSPFLPARVVFAPSLDFALALYTLCIAGHVGVDLALPWDTSDAPAYRGALTYSIGFLYGWGNKQGLFGFQIGFAGLAEWTGDEPHTYAFEAGTFLRLSQPDLSPFIRVRIPIDGPDAGMDVALLFGIGWVFQAWGEEERG